MKIVLAVVVFVIMGCQKATLKRDVVRSPLDSNYHSALIITSFGENFGVAVDRAEMDQPYTFRVQGIHSGTITVASRECGFSERKYYENSEIVDFTVSLKAERCLFGITVMPQFTAEESGGVEWRGVTGVLALRKAYQTMMLGSFRGPSNKPVKVPLNINGSARVFLAGCGLKLNQTVNELESIDVGAGIFEPGDCLLDGFIQFEGQVRLLTIYVTRHDPRIKPLALPNIDFGGREMKVSSERVVSLLSFQNEDVFSSSNKFSYDPGQDRILLAYTSKGRASYCYIDGFGNYKCWN